MRIVCPTSSSSQLIQPTPRPLVRATTVKRGPVATPENAANRRGTPAPVVKQATRRLARERSQQQVHNVRRSARQRDHAAKTRAAEEAKKKNVKKRQVAVGAKPVNQIPAADVALPRHVFIGNLQSSITLERLEEFFRPCGVIRETIIRCSRGQALSLGVSVPDSARSPRDRLYASMAFYDFASVTRALTLNRASLDGTQLVVSISPADMPEVADIALPRLQDIKQNARRGWKKVVTPPPARQVTLQDFSDPRNDNRIRIFGFSFDKCLI